MKIDTSTVNLSSSRTFSEKNQVSIETGFRFVELFDQRLAEFKDDFPEPTPDNAVADKWYTAASFEGQQAVVMSRQFFDELEKMRQILDAIIHSANSTWLKKCCIQSVSLDRLDINPYSQSAATLFEYDYQERKIFTHHEKETTRFSADGVVNTLDGNTIDFSFQMDLERAFFREEQFVYQEKGYALVDPLVINLDITTPRFSGTAVSFDLDMDGENETIPSLMPGSGFLSLDKNQDGLINDGNELFGPATGNGFGELSRYDQDNNFWIDENDEVFDELTLWENNESGEIKLTKIKDAGIGAIYLLAANTPFELRNEDNLLQAKIKKSGIVLNEDGSVSSIQEMDWTA